MTDSISQWHQHEKFNIFGAFVLAFLLFSCGGCSAKVVIPPDRAFIDEPTPMAVDVQAQNELHNPSVSEVLHSEYASWKGVRHRLGGTDKRGVDCSALVQAIFRNAFQVDLPRTSKEQSRVGQKVKFKEKRPGDLVFFVDRGRNHIGVVVDNRRFLHSSSKYGVVISEFEGYWAPRLKRINRVLASN